MIQQSHSLIFSWGNLKTYIHSKICGQIFVAALFMVAKTWKLPRCPSVSEWINNNYGILRQYSVY